MTDQDLPAEVEQALRGKRVLVCVGGGIAAYKVCEVVRLLVRAGAQVHVAMTEAATHFVGPLTFQALSQHPVAVSLLDPAEEQQIGHIGLADTADLAIVAPCTADLAAKLRAGLAGDVVTASLLAFRAPVLLAPSMNVHMWNHPATRENFAALRARGCLQVGPGSGDMACGHVGEGRLSEPPQIVAAAARVFAGGDLAGRRVLVTAGPTREHLDPVRFISNPSSGRMGFALAAEARRRGAAVTLVAGPVDLEAPLGVETVRVVSAAQMAETVLHLADAQDAVLMAAAVSDYRPAQVHAQKVKKAAGPETLVFERTRDILAELGARFAGKEKRPLLVGFAAETENVVANARDKLVRKGADLVVANFVGEGGAFGAAESEAVIVSRDRETPLERAAKTELARRILDEVAARLGPRS